MVKSRSWLTRVFMYLATIVIIVAAFSLLNWLPLIIQKQKLRQFSSPDAAAKELHLKNLHMPTYLPEHLNLSWPPSDIYGQNSPFNALVMYFKYKDRNEIGLAMHQSDSNAPYQLESRLKIISEKSRRELNLKGRKAVLRVAACENNSPCNQISWDEEGTLITLIGRFPAQDLIKIASSMIPGE